MNCSSIRRAAAALLLAVALAAPGTARSAPMIVKMATLAPEGSSWFRVLQEMGEEWRKASDGAVTLRIYPGGVAGDEDAVIRKMRVGQIQAAAITGIGLAYLEPSFYALHIPMMYASDEEFDFVRDRYAPVLERKLEEKGFVVLNWGDAGWVHFFSKDARGHARGGQGAQALPVVGGHEPACSSTRRRGSTPFPFPRTTSSPACRRGW